MFSARYYDFNGLLTHRKELGTVGNEPYEFIWDCSSIPDQNLGKTTFFCEVTDNAGNVAAADIDSVREKWYIVLDRNPAMNTSQFRSIHTPHPIIIDGYLNDWAPSDSIVFANNDNMITMFSRWDRKYLYISARIMDRCIISTFHAGSESVTGMSEEDDLEIYLDTGHTHSCILELPSRQFLFAPAGMAYEVKYFRTPENTRLRYISTHNHRPGILVKTRVSGTLNNEHDDDSCYVIEMAIPWKELNIRPKKSMKIGIEMWNTDRDFRKGYYSFAGWTTTAANLKNPSEWGDLVLVGAGSWIHPAIIFTVAVGGLIVPLLILSVRQRKRALRNEPSSASEKEFIHIAREYVAEHYGDDTLNREMVAGAVGLTSSYFGKEFKKETGIHFSEYLMNYRIEKAKDLLLHSRKSVSEITFEVGFNSQSYFGYVFKKETGLTPKQFREKAFS